tara:strand:+ start:724 stop:954 length:231 start_codon:yes stop_codon:yes gene_type:complete
MTKARQRFVHLAERRTRKAIKILRLIGNLSNRTNYSYEENDVNKIFNALRNEVKASQHRFNEQVNSERDVEFFLEE